MPECHSTNTYALQLCQLPATSEGTVVITANQTAGRGQRGNMWLVEPGKNLTLSVIYKPAFLSLQHTFFLNIITSLAVHDYLLARLDAEVRIKWPNDMMANGKKICGILVETHIQGSRLAHAVIGIGLNVNQRVFSMDTATSVSTLSTREHVLPDELPLLLEKLEARYLQLRAGNLQTLREDYLAKLFWKDAAHIFAAAATEFAGVIQGIDDAGRLQVQTETGLRTFDLKEIQYIR
jgi:BirA family biotin operon repressor/biotin-[acetyl-CoA-carboxylase] ligase